MTGIRDSFLSDEQPGVLRFGGARMALLEVREGFWGLRRQMEGLVGRRLTDTVLQQAGANGGASFARAFVDQIGDAQGLRDCIAAYEAAGFGQFEIQVLEWPIGRALIRAREAFEAWAVQQHGQSPELPVCAYTAGVLTGFVNVLANRHDVVCIERACQAQGAEACLFELLPAEVAGDYPVVALAPDPALGRQLNLLELLFDRMPMGIAVLDRQYRIRRYNPTWKDFAERYGPAPATSLAPGVYYFDHLRGTEPTIIPLFERVLAGETVRQNGVRLESEGVVTYWDIVLAPLVEHDEIVGILNVTVDATERVEARQFLEQRVQERTRELRALYKVLSTASVSLELETVLERSLDAVLEVMHCKVGAVHLLEETGHLLGLAAARGISSDFASEDSSVPVDDSLVGTVIERGEATLVPDIASSALPLRAMPAASKQTYLGVPLRSRGQILGVLSVLGESGRRFAEDEVSLLTHIADEVGIAVENAQLYRQAEQLAVMRERQRLARELHDSVTQALYSLTLLSEAARRMAGSGELRQAQEPLHRLNAISQQALKEMRLLVYELRPLVLKREGLVGALQHRLDAVERRAGVEAHLLVQGNVRLSSEVEEGLYRIAQEALNNALKHAAANSVTVTIRAEGDALQIEVVDDGTGFDPQTARSGGGMGLITMRERAEKMGGRLEVDSAPGRGTRVAVTLQSFGEQSSSED
jgi:signal transduction histidine kinase/predicted hydrocarbon binding protein